MSRYLKCLQFTPVRNQKFLTGFGGQDITIILVITGVVIGFIPFLNLGVWRSEADLVDSSAKEILENKLVVIQGNSLLALSNPSAPEPEVIRRIRVVVTAYSSSPGETDSNPYLTAAGTWVREGVVANNLLPFGTQIRLPEIYGDKIFVVEDRMNSKKGYYHIDIWFPSYWEAKKFGAERTYVEVLES